MICLLVCVSWLTSPSAVPRPTKQQVKAFRDDLDENGDGKVTREEFLVASRTRIKERMREMDTAAAAGANGRLDGRGGGGHGGDEDRPRPPNPRQLSGPIAAKAARENAAREAKGRAAEQAWAVVLEGALRHGERFAMGGKSHPEDDKINAGVRAEGRGLTPEDWVFVCSDLARARQAPSGGGPA